MQAFAHGGDIKSYGDVIDFSANINPLGMPPAVILAAQEAVLNSIHYPDPFCRDVREKIATRDGVLSSQIICGNGAADIIFRLCRAIMPKRAIITAPAFAEYEEALKLCATQINLHMLKAENEFKLDEDFLAELTPEVDIIFLCTPNNPTGKLIPRELIEKIADKCKLCDIVFVLDECFLELCDDGRGFAYLVENNPKLILLRAFTKSFGMPGLRFGYGICSDSEIHDMVHQSAQPWSVSNIAQSAAIAACDCTQWAEAGRALIQNERPRLMAALREFGAEVCDTQANYILFRVLGDEGFREKMLEHGILIRSCGNYHNLSADYYRIAIRGEEENTALICALGEVLHNG